MEEQEKTFITLVLIGALIGIGQMLTNAEPVTIKLFMGRVILGSATSVAAGAMLIWIPDLSPLALTGLASALGIAGYQTIELSLKKRTSRWLKGKFKP
ncbi:phage holin family protein [Arsenophonus nasoniae]|uniref:Phage holin family 2 n=1 Tax=Arsenophonus nasoniae TaxID=638 RepID=D2U2F6_9GAMM|nr:phage holin family protein [Arsenophonus nasoniae]QBY41986.1 Phage holin family 2 [Arsenophonus nasoniae]WGM06183.1 phage holin family protein [Arsenophonus nasoniae]CBA75208.1 phage lysin protein; endolysin [Arsenophonus nasoniae]